MKEALAPGREAWWRTKTGPEWIRENDGNYRVTFWWRDPPGSESHSPIRRGWGDCPGVTDQHQYAPPQTMARIAGTDVWRWSTALSANWRGSYCFMPTERYDVVDACAPGVTPDRNALRVGWRQRLP
ncbi:enterochelin esterase domain-containing protein, partial [Salmonella enterica]|uniref:enterochelin esterase domain-containing protein n=1 Tax=Salmonella enterica TaxID=28901 RepID=UPI003F4C5056